MRNKLKPEEVINIRQYLAAHRYVGAKKVMADKYGVSRDIIRNVFNGKTYKKLVQTRVKHKRICVVCMQQITAHHKWEINEHSQVQHKTCEHPQFHSEEDAMTPKPLALTPLFDALESIGA